MVCVIEYECVKEKLKETQPKKQYGKYTPEIRYEIGKYAVIHGPMAALKYSKKLILDYVKVLLKVFEQNIMEYLTNRNRMFFRQRKSFP